MSVLKTGNPCRIFDLHIFFGFTKARQKNTKQSFSSFIYFFWYTRQHYNLTYLSRPAINKLVRFSNRSKIGVGFGLHFLRVGNTLFHSIVHLPAASLASVRVALTFKNLGRINKQTDGGVCRVAPQLNMLTFICRD